jgi:hypothetical protein
VVDDAGRTPDDDLYGRHVPDPFLEVGPRCKDCNLDGVDAAGNVPCPRCGSADRRLPRDWGDLSAVNAGIAKAAEIERRMLEGDAA